ncbi:MAG: histidine kinase [Hyphomicrobium sp.]
MTAMTIRALAAAAAALTLAACSSSPIASLGSIGSIGGGGTKVTDTDRVFLAAAGSWDRNRDNTVTCDEWKAYATELFDGADANRDDAVDASEWGRIVSIDRMFVTADLKYFDANGDGKLSRAEMVDKPNPVFRLMDTGNTCALNGAQIAGARSKTQYETVVKPPQDGDPREAGGEQGRAANGGLAR